MHEHPTIESIPILAVGDVAAAMSFHAGLGFDVHRYDDDYAFVTAHGHEVFHMQTASAGAPSGGAAYLRVEDADAWYRRLADAGVATSPIVDQPWGMREFSVTDPWGNILRIGSNQ